MANFMNHLEKSPGILLLKDSNFLTVSVATPPHCQLPPPPLLMTPPALLVQVGHP